MGKLNNLNPYYYLEHLLGRMPYIADLEKKDMDAELDKLLSLSTS